MSDNLIGHEDAGAASSAEVVIGSQEGGPVDPGGAGGPAQPSPHLSHC